MNIVFSPFLSNFSVAMFSGFHKSDPKKTPPDGKRHHSLDVRWPANELYGRNVLSA